MAMSFSPPPPAPPRPPPAPPPWPPFVGCFSFKIGGRARFPGLGDRDFWNLKMDPFLARFWAVFGRAFLLK